MKGVSSAARTFPLLVDTHVHLDVAPLGEGAFAPARALGVLTAITMGVRPESWAETVRVARREEVDHALGIHPQLVPELDDTKVDEALHALPRLLRETGAAALGECGLDRPSGDLERQERILLAQLAIARDVGLPISLHVQGAHGEMVRILRGMKPLPAGGVAHSFSGNAELVRDYLAAGLCISFAGGVTRSNAKKPLVAARAVPLDRLVVETDAPFQPAGADARDRKFGEPTDLRAIVTALALARGEDEARLATATTENALRVFPSLVRHATRGPEASGEK